VPGGISESSLPDPTSADEEESEAVGIALENVPPMDDELFPPPPPPDVGAWPFAPYCDQIQ
jgi:hypothetical protein